MAKELSFPFNAVEDELGQPDRQYDATDFATYFSQFISNGIYPNPSSGLQVQSLYNNMVLTVSDGSGYISGYGYVLNSEDEILKVRVNDSHVSYNRKDGIVLQLDLTARKINVIYKAGTASANPLPPALVRNADIYELQLAEILVKSGVNSITGADITDTRLDNNVCGIVHGTVDQIDTTTLYNQIKDDLARFNAEEKAEFIAWLNEIKGILDESTAGNLLNLINALQESTYTKTETDTKLNDKADKDRGVVRASYYFYSDRDHIHYIELIDTPPDSGAYLIQFTPTVASKVGDKLYVRTGTSSSSQTVKVGGEDGLQDNTFIAGFPVTFNREGDKCFFKAGGAPLKQLANPLQGFTAKPSNETLELSYTNTTDANRAGVMFVYKIGSDPTNIKDGTQSDAGISNPYNLTGLTNDQEYHVRSFPYNSKSQYQTALDGAIIRGTPSAVSNRLFSSGGSTTKYIQELDLDTFNVIRSSIIQHNADLGGTKGRLFLLYSVSINRVKHSYLQELDIDTLQTINSTELNDTKIGAIGGTSNELLACNRFQSIVYEFDKDTLAVVRTGTTSIGDIRGTGGTGSRVFACDYLTNELYELDPNTFNTINTAKAPNDLPINMAGTDDRLFHIEYRIGYYYELDPSSLSVINSARTPDTSFSGLGGTK